MATILMIFLRIKLPNLVHLNSIKGNRSK